LSILAHARIFLQHVRVVLLNYEKLLLINECIYCSVRVYIIIINVLFVMSMSIEINALCEQYPKVLIGGGFVYAIATTSDQRTVKIGSSLNPVARRSALQTGSADLLLLVATYRCVEYRCMEKALHNLFTRFRKSGEWFCIEDEAVLNELLSHFKLEKNAMDFPDRTSSQSRFPIIRNGDLAFITESTWKNADFMGNCKSSASLCIAYPSGNLSIKHSSSQPKGSNGERFHLKLSNGTILRSDNVWHFQDPNTTYTAEEVCVGDVDVMDERVVELGYYGELLSSTEKEIQDAKMQDAHKAERSRRVALLKEVCHWMPETCHDSVKEFRREAARMFYEEVRDLHLCKCGIICKVRQIRKRSSINRGQMFYGCRLFPEGCNYYENVQEESDERSRIHSRATNSRYSKKDAGRLAILTGHVGNAASAYTNAFMHGQFRKRKR
jgi:hypothetical protein